jgi:CDP-diacylglycerol--glycerol-3-phosphate 3-phosphatidyltransferase
MERIRKAVDGRLRRLLTPLAGALDQAGVTPDQVTIAGFAVSAAAALLLAAGMPVAAGLVFLAGSGFDLIDGLLARTSNRVTAAGAFLDSTLDRASEGLIFAAIAYRFALDGDAALVSLTVIALLGSLLVSYTRARAEAIGIECTIGILSRPERVVVLGAGMIFGLIDIAVYVIVVLSLFTSLQRIAHVRKALRAAPPPFRSNRPG